MTTYNGVDSNLYNISVLSGQLNSKTLVPGVQLHNLHVDLADGTAYTVALGPGRKAVVTAILSGTVTPLVDISAYLGSDGYVAPGATTQCSDVDKMWIAVGSGNAANTSHGIVGVSLPQRRVTEVIRVNGPLFASLWASCNDVTKVNILGGTMALNNYTHVAYGSLNTNGDFVASSTAAVPSSTPPLRITALLSEPIGYDFFFTLYPEGATPGGPATSGYVAFGRFSAHGSPLKLVPINYFLTGAGRIS